MFGHKMLLSIFFSACILMSSVEARADPGTNSPASPPQPVLSSEVRISTPGTPIDFPRYLPAAAYDSIHNQYLVVWYSQYPGNAGIYAQQVSSNGTRVGPWFAISTGSNDRATPAVAFSATSQEYLVVWVYDTNDDHVHYDIWGRTVAWNGSSMGVEKQVFTWANRAFNSPRVAWDSVHNQFMVISSVYDTQNFWWNDIAGKLVMSDGSTPYSHFQVYQDPAVQPNQGDITYNPVADEYFVVWMETNSSTGEDIYGARVAWDGGITRSAYAMAKETSNDSNPVIATNRGDAYFLALRKFVNVSSKYDLCFRLLNLTGDAYYAGDTTAHCVTLGRSFLAPDVENIAGTDTWLVTTEFAADEGHQVFAMFIELGNTTIDLATYVEAADTPGWTFTNPIVTTGGPGFLIAYEGDNPSIPSVPQHIYGRILYPRALFLPLVRR